MSFKNSKQNTKHKLVHKFNEYCQHSTMHGIIYFYKSTQWVNRVAWLLILGFSAGLTVYLSFMIWQQYVIDPTVTVVESTHYPANNLPFPGIVLCDTYQVYGPQTDTLIEIITRRGFKKKSIFQFFDSILNILNPNFTADAAVNNIYKLLDNAGYPLLTLLDILTKPCSVLLVRCVWRSQEHNCSDMFHRVLTFRGYCCQFDIEYFRLNAGNDTNLATYPDRSRAMEIVLNGEKIYANGSQTYGDVELYIFDPNDSLTIVDTAITLVSKAYFDVRIEMSAMDASSGVKALDLSVRKCMLPTDTVTGSSFYSGCLAHKLLMEVVRTCRCLPYFFSFHAEVEYPNCTWGQYKCVMQTKEDFTGSTTERQAFQRCFQKCDYVQYDAEIEYVELMSKLTTRILDKEEQESHHGLSEVSIHIADRTCMKYRREVLFSWDQMLANIGGIFGLCMGGSIISIIELLWLIIDLIYIILYDSFMSKIYRKPLKVTPTARVVAVGEKIKHKDENKSKVTFRKNGGLLPFIH